LGAIEKARAVISWNPAKEFSPEELESLGRDRLLQLLVAGADNVPFRSLCGVGIIASNAGAFAEPMAEHIPGMVLALAKRLWLNNARLKAGEFDQHTRNKRMKGLSCGVLGFGGIGRAASRLLRGVGLKIFAINTSGMTEEPVDFIGTLDHLEFLLRKSDVLLVSIPLTVRTKGFIGRRELEMMKPDAILINAARGALIEEKALYEHLLRNPDFSVGIDTWWIEPAMDGEFRVNFPFF
jgi:glycerate dehydrogenase